MTASSLDLQVALERLSEAAGSVVSRAVARRALDASEASRPPLERLVRAGARMGLRMRTLELAPSELTRDLLPLAAPARGLVVLTRKGLSFEVLIGDGAARTVSMSGLEELVGGPCTWVAADPGMGLETLRKSTPQGRLLQLLRLEKTDLWIAIVYAVAVGLLALITPLGVQLLVNTVAFGALIQPLVILSLLLLTGLSFVAALRVLQAVVVENLQERLFVRVALDLSLRLPKIERSAFDDVHGPELANRFFEVATIQKGAATLLVDGVSIALATLVGMVLLGFYHPYLLAFAVVLACGIVFVTLVLGRGSTATAVGESKKKYAIADWLEEIARHPRTFGSGAAADLAVRRTEELTVEWLTYRRKHFKVVFRQIIGALGLQAIASAVLLGVGGFLVIDQKLTLGQLVAAELIVSGIVDGFSKLGKYFESYYDLLASVDKLGHIIDLPLQPTGRSLPTASKTALAVEVEDASVDGILDGVSFALPNGAQACVLGRGGAGKTALSDLVAAVRSPSRGVVRIDGADVRSLDPSNLRDAVQLVRGPEIFGGSVMENLTLGRGDIAPSDVDRVLEVTGLRSTVEGLESGVESELTTNAPTFASTVAMRLTIARALAQRPRLLVLDGALDGLDPNEQDVLLRAAKATGSTLLVTTRDTQLAGRFERCIVLDHGKVVS